MCFPTVAKNVLNNIHIFLASKIFFSVLRLEN